MRKGVSTSGIYQKFPLKESRLTKTSNKRDHADPNTLMQRVSLGTSSMEQTVAETATCDVKMLDLRTGKIAQWIKALVVER